MSRRWNYCRAELAQRWPNSDALASAHGDGTRNRYRRDGRTDPAGRKGASGARGRVTDVLGPDRVMVELTSLPADPILDRIVMTAPDKLRVLERAHR